MSGSVGRAALLWRISLVFVAVVAVWLLVAQGLGSAFGPAYEDRIGHAIRAALTTALVLPLIALSRRYLDRRPWSDLRLTSLREGWRSLLFGAVFWLCFAGVGVGVALALGVSVSFETPSVGMLLLIFYLPVLVFLYEALPEEVIFRGYFYRNLSERYARRVAVFGQAVLFTLFGAAIGAAGSIDRIILFFTFALVLGLFRALTDNLWASVGFHMAFQCVTQYLSAAIRSGFVEVDGFPDLEVIAFWFFPIMVGGLALFVASLLHKHSTGRRRFSASPHGGDSTPGERSS